MLITRRTSFEYWTEHILCGVLQRLYDKKIDLKLNPTLGYYYFFDKEHPLSYKDGKVWYHRHVASVKEGRWLSEKEHVHHKDHNKLNNDPDNLEILTAKEHAKRHTVERGFHVLSNFICDVCGKVYKAWRYTQKTCSDMCSRVLSRKVKRPERDELERLVWKIPTVQISKLFGVSDKAIEKWCKFYGIKKPPRGYWTKHAKT